MAGDSVLTCKQENAVVALLASQSIDEAAAAIGVGSRTLYRWLQDDAFAEYYRKARREAVSQAITRLQRAASAAVRTLEEVMDDTDSPATARVSAARVVLELAVKAVELDDLEARLTALERQAGNTR